MDEEQLTASEGVAPCSRRSLLRAASVASVTGLAGCGRVTDYEFRARPVVVEWGASAAPKYETVRREPVVMERSRTVAGAEVTAIMKSHLAVYRTTGDSDRASGLPQFLGVISTPEAVVVDRQFNPLVGLSLPNLLTSGAGVRFLRTVGVDRVGHSRSRVRWTRGPTFLESRAMRLLGTRTALESYAGILGGNPPSVAFVHLARAEDDSVVIVAAMHGSDVGQPDRRFVGASDAYVSAARFGRIVTTVRDGIGFEYGARGNRDS